MENEQSPEINKLAEALCKFQGSMDPVTKDGVNPYFGNSYASLAAIWQSVRPRLSANGLSVVQSNQPNADGITLVTTLMHVSGQWIKGTLIMKPAKSDPQGFGSCLSYARRYAMSAILGIVTEDDDGNAASDIREQANPKIAAPQRKSETTQKSQKENGTKVNLKSQKVELGSLKINGIKDIKSGKMVSIGIKLEEGGVPLITNCPPLIDLILQGKKSKGTATLEWEEIGGTRILLNVEPS